MKFFIPNLSVRFFFRGAAFFWLASLVLWLLVGSGVASAQTPLIGKGFIEEVHFLPGERQLSLAGWVASERPNVFITNLVIHLDDKKIYQGRFESYEREALVDQTGREDWRNSGFALQVAVPSSIPVGVHALTVHARLSDGSVFELLAVNPAHKTVSVTSASPSMWLLILAFGALALPVLFAWGSVALQPRLMKMVVWRIPSVTAFFSIGLFASFCILVGSGVSGSSLGLGLNASGIIQHDGQLLIGENRAIRSDEWEVITPMAISQKFHQPAWPVVNKNIGVDGQNMMVIGMTGVPVSHISSFAKPATWGFFVFDLRRALAWYWWFPFFACFSALWVLLLRMFKLEWRLAALLSLAFSMAPYSVVFSGWPSYAAFFPIFGIVLADLCLRSRRICVTLPLGVLLGLCMSGFVLVLYPAWQISLSYLLIPLAFVWFFNQRRSLYCGPAQWLAGGLAILVCIGLLFAWWKDAAEAVLAIRATFYPGQRLAEAGGDIDVWFLIKGLLTPVLMYAPPRLASAVDASYFWVLLPLGGALVYAWRILGRAPLISVLPVAYVGLVLWFMYFGFSPMLARWTLWGSSTTFRQDVGLGLAQTVLLAWLIGAVHQGSEYKFQLSRRWAVVLCALTVWAAGYAFSHVPPAISNLFSPVFLLLSGLALASASYWLLRGHYRLFVGLYCGWMLIAAVPFNPLVQAPASLVLDARLKHQLMASSTMEHSDFRRVAVVGPRVWSMVLPATGIPVVNTVFYYPPRSFWQSLDPEGSKSLIHNRYQRLLLSIAPLAGDATYRIETPRLDEVRVVLDPVRFNFRLLGAQSVLASPQDLQHLAGNASLKMIEKTDVWVLFHVTEPTPLL